MRMDSSTVGKPPIKYGMSAARPLALAKASAMRWGPSMGASKPTTRPRPMLAAPRGPTRRHRRPPPRARRAPAAGTERAARAALVRRDGRGDPGGVPARPAAGGRGGHVAADPRRLVGLAGPGRRAGGLQLPRLRLEHGG